ncbi:hypothetical protein [Rhizobium sp. WYCCWR 11146]|uniref:hypothetical protein n=1 Tax=Rhizobium sp. WYCCWR 11146 TaxID=2749833 RepID=UPI0015E76DC8|nr:hypothetical protein [Rhizobium sp. WYCCWR 11146]MBA1347688.1 hypothetical protein [Rhizobium sp. WYCCWR 11146]
MDGSIGAGRVVLTLLELLYAPQSFRNALAAAARARIFSSDGWGSANWLKLVIFMVITQPANAATESWTVQPENWESLRTQWEYSHAVNAVITLLAFCCATLASLR